MEIPKEVQHIVSALEKKGFEAYVVGGCVRDLLLGREPEDWDIATSATPEEIQALFPENFYENKFFTVTVQTQSKNPKLKDVEVTTFRSDLRYGDRRHPEEVRYAKTIQKDLSRRDFTMNAIALKPNGVLVDPFGGQKDLKARVIQAVGEAHERFQEDALRMMRGVRFVATLGFSLEDKTRRAIEQNSALLKEISKERVRDELVKIIMADRATEGIEELRKLGLLRFIVPALLQGVGVTQNKHHIYTVWEHNVKSLQYAADKRFSFEVRLASLLHDIGKPATKAGEGLESTFYGHQVVGARMARKALEELKFPTQVIDKIALLIREHMFVYDPEVVTLKGVRRLVSRVGIENITELFELREADRIGSGVPKAQPYRLRHLKAMVEKVGKDPISPKMVHINGDEVMELLGIGPGPKVGAILSVLLEDVLDDPTRNTKDALQKRVRALGAMRQEQLEELAQKAKLLAQEAQERIDHEIKSKYFVT